MLFREEGFHFQRVLKMPSLACAAVCFALLLSAFHPFRGLEGHTWQAHGDSDCGGRKGQRFAFKNQQLHLEVAVFMCVDSQAKSENIHRALFFGVF